MMWYEKLELLRIEKNKTQRELGKEIGSHWVQISRIERGLQMPMAYTLYRLCKALDTTVEYVFEGCDIPLKNGRYAKNIQ